MTGHSQISSKSRSRRYQLLQDCVFDNEELIPPRRKAKQKVPW